MHAQLKDFCAILSGAHSSEELLRAITVVARASVRGVALPHGKAYGSCGPVIAAAAGAVCKDTAAAAAAAGLVVAQDYRRGQALVADRDFAANATFFQDAFEIGRRYKARAHLFFLVLAAAQPTSHTAVTAACALPAVLASVFTLHVAASMQELHP
jgi:Protein of unknown function (DUF2009)